MNVKQICATVLSAIILGWPAMVQAQVTSVSTAQTTSPTLAAAASPSEILINGAKACAELPKDARKVCLEGVKLEANRATKVGTEAFKSEGKKNQPQGGCSWWAGCQVGYGYPYVIGGGYVDYGYRQQGYPRSQSGYVSSRDGRYHPY